GALQDRIAGADWLTDTCAPTVAEQVVVAAGGQNALHAILAATLEPGDAIACGRFVYSGLKALAVRLGLRLVPLPALTAAALEAALAEQPVRALSLVTTNDNPTTHTVPGEERRALADILVRHDLQLIEDDAYGALAADPEPPVTAFAPDRAWYVASTSKII